MSASYGHQHSNAMYVSPLPAINADSSSDEDETFTLEEGIMIWYEKKTRAICLQPICKTLSYMVESSTRKRYRPSIETKTREIVSNREGEVNQPDATSYLCLEISIQTSKKI